MYDRIHLSNIPDYIGGSLTAFLYALPVVHPGTASYVTANCLRNPPRFKSHDHFNNEYLAFSDPKALEKLFHVSMPKFDNPTEALILTEYAKWRQKPVSQSFPNLLPRAQVETWLLRLFLKLAIPKERQIRDFTLIYSPLNLTAFLRLCGHLHNVGYPAHWLSSVLDEILSGKIRTSARPPRTEPLSMDEVKANLPMIEQTTAPFVAEMTTFLSLWQFFLPSGVLSPRIPIAHSIHKYEVRFDTYADIIAEPPAFVIVFFSMRLLPQEAEKSSRPFLMSDETGAKGAKERKAREEGIHVVSTWSWDSERQIAGFWLSSDLFEGLDRREWGVSIWRTDAWVRQAGPLKLDGVRDLGPWI